MDFSHYLESQLSQLEQAGLRRQLRAAPEGCISFCDNDYLGLAGDERIAQAAAEQGVSGGTASRLVDGENPLYEALESKLTRMKSAEAALVFTSGFSMNIGIIPALAQKEDIIFADKLSHASLIDGCRASAAAFRRFSHNDLESLERLLKQNRTSHRHSFIVTESIFSMDGDRAPIDALLRLAERYDCQLIADDAHGFGVVPTLPAHPRLIQLGTLSKAVGSLGGYVCGSQTLREYLINKCRSLIYTTALPPMVLASSLKSLEIIEDEPERAQKALQLAAEFSKAFALPPPQSAIVPMIIGDEEQAVGMAKALEVKGFYVVAIRPPTVPAGTARLRFTFSARHTEAQVQDLISAVKEVAA